MTNKKTLITMIPVVIVCAFLIGMAFIDRLADNTNVEKKLPVPRFVTLSADDVNIRVGPGTRYPIKLVFKKEGLPVEIIKEFDVWREIKTIDGEEGWVHKAMLSGKRAVIIKDETRTVYRKPNAQSKPRVKLQPGVIADFNSCNGLWCSINVEGYSGWIRRDEIWGVYPSETFVE